jgi:hypothetical protein
MMSFHPNAVLMLVLTPDDLARKTHGAIISHLCIADDDEIEIGDDSYNHKVMEDDYDENSQLSAPEGSIIVWNMVTYGYGEVIKWSKLELQKNELEEWAKEICKMFNCSYEIYISANYW